MAPETLPEFFKSRLGGVGGRYASDFCCRFKFVVSVNDKQVTGSNHCVNAIWQDNTSSHSDITTICG